MRISDWSSDVCSSDLVTPGYYCASTLLPPESRFTTSPPASAECSAVSASANAVRVEASAESPVFFARPFLSAANQPLRISASATAMRVDAAGLRAGTGVASILTADSLVMNPTINSLLGGGHTIVRAHVCTLVTNAQLVFRLLLEYT